MKHTNKKGFTIVELVIVIAVIAILAAVLIPTFTNLIKKANESSDMQAVRQMNTILAAENAFLGGITINDAVAALKEAGFNSDKYVPLVAGTYFFYDQDTKQIVYVDGENNVIYPKGAEIEGHALFSLSGQVPTEDYDLPVIEGDTATFTINTAAEFAQLAADFKDIIAGKDAKGLEGFEVTLCASSQYVKGVANQKIVINLTQDIDMRGAAFNLNLTNCTFILNGNGHTISGVVNNSGFAVSSGNSENKATEYGGAFLGYVSDSIVEFNNVTFENCRFGNETVKASAIFVGQFNGDSTLTLNNTAVVDCTVDGLKGVAVYLGHACGSGNQSVIFNGTNTVSGCELNASATEAKDAGLVGTIIGRISGANKTVNGTVPSFNLTITSAGSAVEVAGRDIINAQGNFNADLHKVSYNGNWIK